MRVYHGQNNSHKTPSAPASCYTAYQGNRIPDMWSRQLFSSPRYLGTRYLLNTKKKMKKLAHENARRLPSRVFPTARATKKQSPTTTVTRGPYAPSKNARHVSIYRQTKLGPLNKSSSFKKITGATADRTRPGINSRIKIKREGLEV